MGRGKIVFSGRKVVLYSDVYYYNIMIIDTEKDISFEDFTSFVETFYLQSLKELKEMDEEDMEERCCDNEREGLEINTQENVMGNVNMIIEDIDVKRVDKLFN